MLSKTFFHAMSALIFTQTIVTADAAPAGLTAAHRCSASPVQGQHQSIIRVRDTRTSAAGGGGGNGGDNTCWSSCFKNYNECVDTGPKTPCVTRMKSCLELCDRLSNKPRM